MDRKDKLEGEEIQKGLEQFLEQELYGTAGKAPVQKKAGELDLLLAQTQAQAAKGPDIILPQGTDELDISLARQSSRTKTERVTATGRSGSNHRESGQREMSQRKKQEPVKTGRQGTVSNKRQEQPKSRRQNPSQNKRQELPKSRKQEPVKGKKAKQEKAKKKKNRAVKILVFLGILFVIGFAGLYMFVGGVYKKMNYKEAEGFTTEAMKEDGVINVLLIGNDSRLEGDDGRSDAMILVSISDKTKTITMTSLLRDMYVEIPGHGGNRLNAAYSYGGPELLMETIEQNFDIPVHRYALVNFQAFANLVDAVGGVDLELTNEEVQYVNGYLMEYNQLEGRDLATDFLDPSLSGMIHLNGPQALAFTRNRYIGTDFGRTERQRKVLSAVIDKLPAAMLKNSGELTDGLFPNLTTNLKQGECYNLSLNAWKFLGYDMVQQCVPVEGTYSNATIREMAVLEVDFEANKRFLKQTLYGE